jgi:hypothetical protein
MKKKYTVSTEQRTFIRECFDREITKNGVITIKVDDMAIFLTNLVKMCNEFNGIKHSGGEGEV